MGYPRRINCNVFGFSENIVPADALLLFETHPIVVDESTATGESKTLTKSIESDPFFLSGTKITDVKCSLISLIYFLNFRDPEWFWLLLLERRLSMEN